MSQAPAPMYLLVTPWSPASVGGVSQVVINLYWQIRNHGKWHAGILVSTWHGPEAPNAELALEAGVPFFRMRLRSPLAAGGYGLKALLVWLVLLPIHLLAIARFLKRENVAIVNFHAPGSDAINFILLRKLGLFKGQVLLSYHGADLRQATAGRRWLHAYMQRHADHVVVVSQSMVRLLADRAHNVMVIPNGIEPDVFFAATDRQNAPEREKGLLVCVATLEHKKGIDVLLEAMPRIISRLPYVRLLIAGRSTPFRPHLEKLVRERGLEDFVKILCDVPHEQIPGLMLRSEAFVLPSRIEPFGIVLLEAGLCGLPVVAAAVGGIPDIIRHQQTGLLIPPDDPQALAEAVIRLLDNSAERSSFSEALARHVAENFGWKAAYASYDRLADTSFEQRAQRK